MIFTKSPCKRLENCERREIMGTKYVYIDDSKRGTDILTDLSESCRASEDAYERGMGAGIRLALEIMTKGK